MANLHVQTERKGNHIGVLSDIKAISATSAQLATDQATLTTLTNSVAAQAAMVTTDQGALTPEDAQLSTDLQASGPAFVVNSDGTASVYQFSSNPPGYTITVASPAS